MTPIESLAEKLRLAFDPPGVPQRNRYIFALRAFAELIDDLGLPAAWRGRLFELGLALGELGEGITPALLKPEARTDGGRPSDEWRIWIVRSRAVIALEARLRAKMSLGEALKQLKKRFPSLDSMPFTKKGQLKTSIRNWQRKMAEIKRGDHLDLVAERHEDARARLSDLDPKDAISVADTLLQNVLR
jgi:hypothetical protein